MCYFVAKMECQSSGIADHCTNVYSVFREKLIDDCSQRILSKCAQERAIWMCSGLSRYFFYKFTSCFIFLFNEAVRLSRCHFRLTVFWEIVDHTGVQRQNLDTLFCVLITIAASKVLCT